MKKKIVPYLSWILTGIIGTYSFASIAIKNNENISSIWFITAFFCIQIIAYRFYSLWIALKILHIDPKKPTPAFKFSDGKDYVPTNKWMVFGHHFAAIAGPGPLIGPTLASQFGYLPGTIWILVGSVLAGAVQDMVILFFSIRKNGKSLGKMIEEEIGKVAGFSALIGTFAIIIILISVLGLIIVKALAHSPWGSFTVLMTVPIAMLVGVYLNYVRPNGVLEASIFGLSLFLLAVYGGKIIHHDDYLNSLFNFDAKTIAFGVIIYGFLAATLPVWLLLTPRDYLSSFLKIGTILLLAIALLMFQPTIKMPQITQFIDGSGPIFSGKIFPFLFITIGCGAISGFHALVASGTTPKIISSENDIRLVGYGSMLLEGFVAIMALISACILDPAIYFAINSSVASLGSDAIATINNWGFPIHKDDMINLAQKMGENTLFSRTGGAPSLAVGMAQILSTAFGEKLLSMWYHFAIMFEAIFILTTLDAGTRVARFMLEDLLKFRDKKLHESTLAGIFSSLIVVSFWGYFLYIGVIDPNGGVNILWPLFGMSNQMLACIALTLATFTIYKKNSKKIYCLITLIPLVLITLTTSSAVIMKVFSSNPKIGFLASADSLQEKIITQQIIDINEIQKTTAMIFNQKLVASIAMFFLIILWVILISSIIKLFFNRNE